MKRLLSLFLCLLLCLSLIPAAAGMEPEPPAETENVYDSGYFNSGRAQWIFNDGTLTIRHVSEYPYALPERGEEPWATYINGVQTLVIESGCSTIPTEGFSSYPSLVSVSIPYSVTTIGYRAFYSCKKLETVNIPYTVTTFGQAIFGWCTKLKNVQFASGVTQIGPWMFQGCESLTSIDIPDTVTVINELAFQGSGIRNLTIPASVARLERNALANMYSVETVTFLGSPPTFVYDEVMGGVFENTTATVYTPTGSNAWPTSSMQQYGGTLTWANRPVEPIASAAVTITEPAVGAAPDYDPVLPSGANYYSDAYNTANYHNDVRWQFSDGGYLAVDSAIFEAGREYAVFIYLTPKNGYTFSESCTGTINGKTAEVHLEGSGQLRLSYHFPALASKPTITTQPKSQTAAPDTTVKFTVKASDAASYQWYYRTSSTGTWAKSTLTGAKTATLSVKATAARNGYQYKCRVSNAAGYVYTNAVTLTVASKPTITTQPKSQTAAPDTTVKFTVKAGGTGLTYQWYYRTSSTGTWAKSTLTGAKTATLSVKATAARNGYQYKCRVSNAAGYVYTNAVTLTVASKPTITTQPKSQTVSADTTVKFTVKADGTGLTYQWYYRTSSTGTWAKSTLTGAKTATLTVKATAARNGYQYKCRVSNAAGYVYSSVATLKVTK